MPCPAFTDRYLSAVLSITESGTDYLYWVSWSCPGLLDSFIKTACLVFKSHRADVTKITVAAFPIVKTLNVIEHIGLSFTASSVTYPIHTFAFQYAKKTLDHRVVIAVTAGTHAAIDTVL